LFTLLCEQSRIFSIQKSMEFNFIEIVSFNNERVLILKRNETKLVAEMLPFNVE
jgi:hypothetical protein